MPATVQSTYFGGNASEPAGTNIDNGSGGVAIAWDLADSVSDATTPITIPSSTGTNYSWYKLLGLKVTGTAATSLSNRKLSVATTPTTGLHVYFEDQATYTQPSGANKPADSGSDGHVPSGYTELTTTPQTWDSSSVSAGSTGRNGHFAQSAFGVDSTYAGGAGSSTALPNLTYSYDEA
jgi:hypothetical protein